MLNRKLSVLKWASLVGLAVGVATVQLQGVDTSREGHGGANPFLGFLAVTIGCTSELASTVVHIRGEQQSCMPPRLA